MISFLIFIDFFDFIFTTEQALIILFVAELFISLLIYLAFIIYHLFYHLS